MKPPRRSTLVGIMLVVLGGAALTWPALHNGFPLVYQDTAWYLGPLIHAGQHPLRTIGYTLFVAVALTAPSFWSIVAAQAAVTSALLTRVAWLAADRPRDRPRFAAFGLLAVLLLSGAAKYSSWLMADITAAWLFLAGALWLLSDRAGDRVIAFAIGGLAVLAHNSHLPIVLATTGVIALASIGLQAKTERRRPLALFAASCCLVPIVWLANGLAGERAQVLRGTEPLLLYSLSDSGVLLDTLDDACAERGWQMCAYRSDIEAHVGEEKGWLLFDGKSPFYRVGGYESAEVPEIVRHAFVCCWPRILTTTLAETWRQFWEIDSQDGLLADDTMPALDLLQNMARLRSKQRLATMPAGWGRFRTRTAQVELGQLWRSRQRTDGAPRVLLHPFPEQGLQALLLLVGAVLAAWAHRRGERRPAYLFGALCVFLAANAAVCALGSSVNGRYQGRVSWLLAFAVALGAGWTARSTSAPDRSTARRTAPRPEPDASAPSPLAPEGVASRTTNAGSRPAP